MPFMQRINDMLNPDADFLVPAASRVFMFTQLLWAFPSGVQWLECEGHISLLRVYDVLSAIHYMPLGVVKNLTLP